MGEGYEKTGYERAELAHRPWREHPWAVEKPQVLEHQRLCLSDRGWQAAQIPPALSFCTSSCNRYVTRICKQSKKKCKNMIFFFLSTGHLPPVNVEHNPLCSKSNKQDRKASVLQLDPSPWQRANLIHDKQLGRALKAHTVLHSPSAVSYQSQTQLLLSATIKEGGERKRWNNSVALRAYVRIGEKWCLPQFYYDWRPQMSSPSLFLLN